MFVLIDAGSIYLNKYINTWYTNHLRKHKKLQEMKNKKSKAVIRRKIAPYKSKYWLST